MFRVGQTNWPLVWQALGDRLAEAPDSVELAKLHAQRENPWFTIDHIETALTSIQSKFLNASLVEHWLQDYDLHGNATKRKRVGIVCAGNIPMVAFHDIMCTITSGHHAVIKLSHKDQFLIPALCKELIALHPRLSDVISFVNKLENYDAVIATGSDNSHRYFKAYFGHVPHIFRKNRTSVGVIHEHDSDQNLLELAKDIFIHFGLGCRNISKLFIPHGFDMNRLFEATMAYSAYALHSKYRNNFIYHSALFQMNKVNYFTNDLLILLETEEWHSPLSVVYYSHYEQPSEVTRILHNRADDIQAIYSSMPLDDVPVQGPGAGQEPNLWDYADQVDTLSFLLEL